MRGKEAGLLLSIAQDSTVSFSIKSHLKTKIDKGDQPLHFKFSAESLLCFSDSFLVSFFLKI